MLARLPTDTFSPGFYEALPGHEPAPATAPAAETPEATGD
jgi:hypothetical protein